MRTKLLACTLLAAVAASPVLAQQAAPPKTPFMSDKDIMALVEKAKADRRGDAPIVAEPILLLAPYKAQLEYRPGKGPAAVHEKDAELMVVLDGAGDILTDGTLVNGKRINSANLERAGHRQRRFAHGRQRRHDPDSAEHAASDLSVGRQADRAHDDARAVSARELAACQVVPAELIRGTGRSFGEWSLAA